MCAAFELHTFELRCRDERWSLGDGGQLVLLAVVRDRDDAMSAFGAQCLNHEHSILDVRGDHAVVRRDGCAVTKDARAQRIRSRDLENQIVSVEPDDVANIRGLGPGTHGLAVSVVQTDDPTVDARVLRHPVERAAVGKPERRPWTVTEADTRARHVDPRVVVLV
jgi:hypothetical protein